MVQLLLTNGADPNKVDNVSIINNEVYMHVLIVYYIYCITVLCFNLAIRDLRSKSPFLKPPIITAHAHSNAHLYLIAKLKTVSYIFME